MSLTIVALLLFLAMVVAWVVLPGGAAITPVQENADDLAPNTVGQTV